MTLSASVTSRRHRMKSHTGRLSYGGQLRRPDVQIALLSDERLLITAATRP